MHLVNLRCASVRVATRRISMNVVQERLSTVKPVKTIRKRWFKWLNRRMPPAREVRLDQKKIFVFPTRYGFFYIGTLFLLFLGGINYQNSLILNLCFLLASLFVITILHTFRNLSGLLIKAGHTEPAFVGGQAGFEVILARDTPKRYEAINLIWHDNESGPQNVVDGLEQRVKLLLDAHHRGYFRPRRLKLESSFPLGIVRAWTWIDLDMKAVVYPDPIPAPERQGEAVGDQDSETITAEGDDDFDQLRPYRVGESLNNIAWKQVARGQGFYSKTFHGYKSESQWITWDSVRTGDVERKLSQLTYLVIQAASNGKPYGLDIPGTRIEPSEGGSHEKRCLTALALYGIQP